MFGPRVAGDALGPDAILSRGRRADLSMCAWEGATSMRARPTPTPADAAGGWIVMRQSPMLVRAAIRVYNVLSGRGVVKVESLSLGDSETQDARKAGGRYSRGNVPIQQKDPAFVTPGDLEREREDLIARPLPE